MLVYVNNAEVSIFTGATALDAVRRYCTDSGIAIDSDGAECLIRFLEKKAEVDYEGVSRVDTTIED